MTAFIQVGYNKIPRLCTSIVASTKDSGGFAVSLGPNDLPVQNLFYGGSSIYWRNSDTTAVKFSTFDLTIPSNQSAESVSYAALRGLNLMFKNGSGNVGIEIRGSSDSFVNENDLVLQRTRTAETDLMGSHLEDILIEGNYAYITADADISAGTTSAIAYVAATASDWANLFSTVVSFADNSLTRLIYFSEKAKSGRSYKFSAYIRMNDGTAPNFTGTPDFRFVSNGTATSSGVTVEDLGGGLYKVSRTYTGSGTTANHGILKQAADSVKGFKVQGFELSPVATTSYKNFRIRIKSENSIIHRLRKIYLGNLFTFGDKSPFYPYTPGFGENGTPFTADSGTRFKTSMGRRSRFFSFSWRGITDAVRIVFENEIWQFLSDYPIFLYQPAASDHEPLSGTDLIFGWAEAEVATKEWKNNNQITLSITEDIIG